MNFEHFFSRDDIDEIFRSKTIRTIKIEWRKGEGNELSFV